MSLVTDLPAIFDQFSEARQKGFLTVMDLKERGIPLVGTYCTFMPQEIPMAAGAVVVSLCSTSDETIEEAEKDLPRNLCPLIKSSYGFGKTDKCPYFNFSDLVVGVKWSTKTGHRVRVFSSIDFPIRLVVTHHYIRAVLVRCNIQRYSPLLRELHR